MGVHGLWRLLDSFGVVVQPDSLKGKRVAIDASIWIAQLRARTAPGEDLDHCVMEGFLARILKLVFYGISPVFVFDGVASSSKGAEQQRRNAQRERYAQALLRRRARQILSAQLAAGTVDMEELKAALSQAPQKPKDNGAPDLDTALSTSGGELAHEGCASFGSADLLPPQPMLGVVANKMGKPQSNRKRHCSPMRLHRKRSRLRRTRRRLPLAPDTVSSRSTRHFLRDVEGLLEDRARQEARVLYNALQLSSTSLFMGPRSVVDGGTEDLRASALPSLSQEPARDPPAPEYNLLLTPSADEEEEEVTDYVCIDGRSDPKAMGSSDSGSVTPSDKDAENDVEEVCLVVEEEHSEGAPHHEAVTPPLSRLSTTLPETQVLGDGVMQYLNMLSQEPQVAPSTRSSPEPGVMRGEKPSSSPSLPSVHVVSSSSSPDGAESDATAEKASEPPSRGDDSSEESTTSSEAEMGRYDTSEEDEEDVAADGLRGAAFAWQPFTQQLGAPSLLQQSTQACSSGPELTSSSPVGCKDATALPSLTPPPMSATRPWKATAGGGKGTIDEDDDYAPVERGWQPIFALRCCAEPTISTSFLSGGADKGGGASLPVPAVGKGGHSGTTGGAAACVTPSSPHAVSRMERAGRVCADATTVTTVPFDLVQIVELLDCFGIPYVMSPGEADAQCAFLARQGLVDAVFTEDSDVLVHGATTVLRGFFTQSKQVVAYQQAELAACGITKTVLVALALLLGCDYAEGVCGIGLMGALEALVTAWTTVENIDSAAQSAATVLHVLRRWAALVERPPPSWEAVDEEMTLLQFALLQSHAVQWRTLELRSSFPERHAAEAFYDADFDSDTRPFQWGHPDWHRIRLLAGSLGALSSTWLVRLYDLAKKESLRRQEEEEVKTRGMRTTEGQTKLTDFGLQERLRQSWAFQKQNPRHASVLSMLRALQAMQ